MAPTPETGAPAFEAPPAGLDASGNASQLRRVAAILSEIGAAQSLEAALAALGRGAITLLGGAQAAVRAYGATEDGVNLAFWVSPDGVLTPADAPIPTPASVAGQLLAGGPPCVVEDLWALDPADSPIYAQLRERGLRSSVAVPIVAGGQRIGSLHVDHPAAGYFTDLHLALAEALAIQAGAAIERARQVSRRGAEDRLRAMYAEAREQTDTHVALNASLRELADENARLLREARAALEERDDFLNTAAHELKTPMTVVLGLAQVAQRKLVTRGELSREDVERYVQTIAAQTARLSRVIDRMIDGAQLQNGSLAVLKRPSDLAALARDAAALLMVDSNEHPVILRLPSEPLVLELDPDLIRQVILSLLDNAVRFSAPPSDAVSRRRPIVLTVRHNGAMARLAVRDHGVGIPPEHLPHLFKPFNPAHRALQLSGVGLGLAIARRVVELHGGKISASRPPNGGTRVAVTLPIT